MTFWIPPVESQTRDSSGLLGEPGMVWGAGGLPERTILPEIVPPAVVAPAIGAGVEARVQPGKIAMQRARNKIDLWLRRGTGFRSDPASAW